MMKGFKMKSVFVSAGILSCIFSFGGAANASPETDALVACVKENTTDADNEGIIQLMTLMFAAHPAASKVVEPMPDALETVEAQVGEYIERLFALDCLPEMRASLKADKGRGLGKAVQAVMLPIMQSLQAHAQASDIGQRMFSKVERERLEKLLKVD